MSIEREVGFNQDLKQENEVESVVKITNLILDAVKEEDYAKISAYKELLRTEISKKDSSLDSKALEARVVATIETKFKTGLAHLYAPDGELDDQLPEENDQLDAGVELDEKSIQKRQIKESSDKFAACLSALIREPSQETGAGLLKQLSEAGLDAMKKNDIDKVKDARAIKFSEAIMAGGDIIALIEKYKKQMQDHYLIEDDEVTSKLVNLFKNGLGQLYNEDFNDKKYDDFFDKFRNIIISIDDDPAVELIKKQFDMQRDELISTLKPKIILEQENEVESVVKITNLILDAVKEQEYAKISAYKELLRKEISKKNPSLDSSKLEARVVATIETKFKTGLAHLYALDGELDDQLPEDDDQLDDQSDIGLDEKSIQKKQGKESVDKFSACLSAFIREPLEGTGAALLKQLSEVGLDARKKNDINEVKDARAIKFSEAIMAGGDIIALIEKYKKQMQDHYLIEDDEVTNKLVNLFKNGLGQLYNEDFNDEKYDDFFATFGKLIIFSDNEEISKEMNQSFNKQLAMVKPALTLKDIAEDVEDAKEVQLPKVAVQKTFGEVSKQRFVKGMQDLRKGISEADKKKAVSMIRGYIEMFPFSDISSLSAGIIDQYKLDRDRLSVQVLSSRDFDLEGFVYALIREVRRREEDKDDNGSINEFIAQAAIAFNQGEVSYALWVSGMNQAAEEIKASIRVAVAEERRSLTKEYKRNLNLTQYSLEEAEEKVKELQETVSIKSKLVAKIEREKQEAEREHDIELMQKNRELEEKSSQINQLQRDLVKQKSDMKKLHADEIKDKNSEIKERDEKIERLEEHVRYLKRPVKEASSRPSQERELSDRIILPEGQLKIAIRQSSEKPIIIAEKEQELPLLETKAEKKEFEPVVLTPLSMPTPTIDSLSPLIIALGVFESHGKVESKASSKKSLANIAGLIERLTLMQAAESTTPEQIIAVTKECADVISTLDRGSLSPLLEHGASHGGIVKWIQEAAIQVQAQERSTVSPQDLKEMRYLADCIDKIILPTLMMQSGEANDERIIKGKKNAINEIDKILQDLHAGTMSSKDIQPVKDYVRTFFKEYCLSSINEMHKNKNDLSLVKRMSAHYNALASGTEITTAKLKSIADELEVITNVVQDKNAKSMAKNDGHFTDQDVSIILAALQVEGMRGNGWKIDNKKLKLMKGDLFEFTVPLTLEKPGRLLWSGKQTVALNFSKAPDGSFIITSLSKDANAVHLVDRVREHITHPEQTRDLIDRNANPKRQQKK